ncbi:hypothetical protein GC163_14040 [bacterium]|nr:hypothetical protein [bacterium]
MHELIDLLFYRTLWQYDPARDWTENTTRYFNLLEATAWVVFAALVLIRWKKHRRSGWEWVYAALFLAFAWTDFHEATILQSWLLWVKAIVLAGILRLRWWLLRIHYPNSRTY